MEVSFSKKELEVTEILTRLHCLFPPSNNLPFPYWGSKRKRSCIDPSASLSSPRIGNKTHVEVEASSPTTPLSFSPSDSDSKSKNFRKRAIKKKTINQLKDIVIALSAQGEQLKHEVSKVKGYHEKLRSVNLQLKTRKLELEKRVQLDLKSCKSLVISEEPAEQPIFVFEEKQAAVKPQLHEPSIIDTTGTAKSFRWPHVEMSFLPESGAGLNLKSTRFSHSIPDMNSFADDATTRNSHCKAAIAAQARKRRIEINRVKNSLALKQLRLR